jgi:heme exporter protein A
MPSTTIYLAPPRRALEAPPAVATRDLARLFGRGAALVDVSIEIEAGRCIALTGPNGAGKTTLLRVLATILRPTYGMARVDGIDVAAEPHLVRERVAFLSHATGLYADLTAAENLAFAATMLGLSPAEGRERVPEVLDAVGLRAAAHARVGTFSAGMRRRLALGRTILGRPSLVLLDEPHAALDGDGMALVDRLLAGWREVGVTTLVASHQVERVAAVADGSVALAGGMVSEVVGDGVVDRTPSRDAGERPGAAPALQGAVVR